MNALGRSRGGFGTKVSAACDGLGRALAFGLQPGHRGEVRVAPALLDLVLRLGPVGRVVCDRGYSSKAWRDTIRDAGAIPVVPSQKTHPHVEHDRPATARRHRVENLWARLKKRRAIATRYDKTAASFLGSLHLAAALDWLAHRA